MASSAAPKLDLDERLRAAGGRCECTGECGHNHRWSAPELPLRCRAPHGCNVVRKLDHPSCWRLAGTDAIPLAYAELYSETITTVALTLVKDKVYCGFCRGQLQRRARP